MQAVRRLRAESILGRVLHCALRVLHARFVLREWARDMEFDAGKLDVRAEEEAPVGSSREQAAVSVERVCAGVPKTKLLGQAKNPRVQYPWVIKI